MRSREIVTDSVSFQSIMIGISQYGILLLKRAS